MKLAAAKPHRYELCSYAVHQHVWLRCLCLFSGHLYVCMCGMFLMKRHKKKRGGGKERKRDYKRKIQHRKQVPQYIVEDCWARGEACRVLCTQPRRISAMTVSERVAAERGERIGADVGYTIRLESKGGPQSAIMFCTNGVLLRMVTGGSDLRDLTHILVDEIHERDKCVV